MINTAYRCPPRTKHGITLSQVNRNDIGLLRTARNHYALQKGMPPGRLLCLKIECDGVIWGYICSGSSTWVSVGGNGGVNRNTWFRRSIPYFSKKDGWNRIVDNIFFHVDRGNTGKYPRRNFTDTVLELWREQTRTFWKGRYGITIMGFQTMVGGGRNGQAYLRDKWNHTGYTYGMSRSYAAGKYASNSKITLSQAMGTVTWTSNQGIKSVFLRRV